MRRPATLALGALLAAGLLAGCTTNADAEGATVVDVESSDDACDLSAGEAPSGSLTFRVRNTGERVTEFYLLDGDGSRVVGEVEDIGPGLTRDLVVSVAQGSYVTACKPGMKGAGIRAPFEVTAADR